MSCSLRTSLLLLCLAMGLKVSACDVCGAAMGNQSLGLLPQFSKHFVGMRYLYTSAHSSHPSLFGEQGNETSNQQYQNIQLWGKYQLSKRIQLFAFLPVVQSLTTNATQRQMNRGLGDASIIANVSVPLKQHNKSKRLLLAGLGLKLPTGQYQSNTTSEAMALPNTQTGTGSLDFLANINYTQKGQSLGYNVDLSYALTTANKQQYKFGNKCVAAATAFYWLESQSLKIVPQLGASFEYSLHNYDNFAKKWLNEQTGGALAFASIGSQFYYKQFGANASIQLPFYQHYADGIVHNNARLEGGIFILF